MLLSGMERTLHSIEFELLWRTLRKDGELIPSRDTLLPLTFKKFVTQLALCEVKVLEEQLLIKLVGGVIRNIAGFNINGLDLNASTIPKHLPARLERQKLYHDHGIGRVGTVSYQFTDGTLAYYEVTGFPLWGNNRERLVLFLVTDIGAAKNKLAMSERMNQVGYYNETPIDIGAGVPPFEYHVQPLSETA